MSLTPFAVLASAAVQDKNVVVLPRELSRHDIRLIMYNVLNIFGTTNNEKSIITRNTIQQLGFVQEVRCAALANLSTVCSGSVLQLLMLLWPMFMGYSCSGQHSETYQGFARLYFNSLANCRTADILNTAMLLHCLLMLCSAQDHQGTTGPDAGPA